MTSVNNPASSTAPSTGMSPRRLSGETTKMAAASATNFRWAGTRPSTSALSVRNAVLRQASAMRSTFTSDRYPFFAPRFRGILGFGALTHSMSAALQNSHRSPPRARFVARHLRTPGVCPEARRRTYGRETGKISQALGLSVTAFVARAMFGLKRVADGVKVASLPPASCCSCALRSSKSNDCPRLRRCTSELRPAACNARKLKYHTRLQLTATIKDRRDWNGSKCARSAALRIVEKAFPYGVFRLHLHVAMRCF